jgi:hypothetical protein
VWTHLEGGSVTELVASYRKLSGCFDAFDHLVPGHNEPWLDRDLLPESLTGAEKVLSGEADYREAVDLWNRPVREYSLGRFKLLTRR